jgi:hypothetical protein
MNVELPKSRGHSFKHTVAYITHDKRAEGAEFHPTTADRVEWAETRNMGGVGPETGWRVMLDTFRNRDALKAAAGVKSRRLAKGGPVYHFSIDWHPEERGGNPSKAAMLEAAEQVLKIMGAEHLQAVMSAHTDTGKPHLHVVLSLVCPETGRMHAIGPDKADKLDRWSLEFEKAGGRIWSPNRAAKYAEIERKKAAHPDPDERRQHVAEQQEKARAAANDRAAMSDQAKAWSDVAGPKPRTQGAILRDKAEALKLRHRQERGADWEAYKAGKDYIWKQRPDIKAMAAAHRAETRPLWSAFGKQQAAERKEFYALQRSFLGRLVIAAKFIEREGWQFGMKGYLGMLFSHAAQPKEWRVEQLAKHQAADKAAFAVRTNAPLDAKIAHARAEHGARLARFSAAYDLTKQKTADRQADERGALNAEWKEYWDRRDKAAARRGEPLPSTKWRKPDRAQQSRAATPQNIDPHATPTAQKSRTGAVWEKAAGRPKPPELRAKWGEKAKPAPRDRTPRPRGRDDFEPEI